MHATSPPDPRRPAARRLAFLSAAFLLATLGAVGCSDDPRTAPTAPGLRESLTTSAKKPVGGTGTAAPTNTTGTVVADEAITVIPVPVTGLVTTTTKRISAASGGMVTAGRHTLCIAPGALKKDTDITVSDVSARVGHVEVELLPEGLQFQADATLWTRTWDLTSATNWHIYWITTGTNGHKKGQDLGGEVYSMGGLGILAHLQHFSTYKPGKAGW